MPPSSILSHSAQNSLSTTTPKPTISPAIPNAPNNNPKTFCISSLEHDLHDTFASTRVPSTSYIYVPRLELDSVLDNFCNSSAFSSSSSYSSHHNNNSNSNTNNNVLVISGPSGYGKSTLLSNWHLRHKTSLKRNRTQTHELVFTHIVGCSRSSTETYFTLRRLLTSLKTHFELTPSIPSADSKLQWELPRFLDLASKKGKIIIVIDGLHRLKCEGSVGETNLGMNWLPLVFPANVKVVISTTSPGDSDDYENENENEHDVFDSGDLEVNDNDNVSDVKKKRVIQELERRRWRIVNVGALNNVQANSVIEEYQKLSEHMSTVKEPEEPPDQNDQITNTNTTNNQTSSFLTEVDEVNRDIDESTLQAQDNASLETSISNTLLLFPTLKTSILSNTESTNPLYLRTLIYALDYGSKAGYDLWTCTDKWLQSDTVKGLYDLILQTFEDGYIPSLNSVSNAKECCMSDGGFDGLIKSHPWNITLKGLNSINGGLNRKNSVIDVNGMLVLISDLPDDNSSNKDDAEVIQVRLMKEASRRADGRLVGVRELADKKLFEVFRDIERRVKGLNCGDADGRDEKEPLVPLKGTDFLTWLESEEGRDAIPMPVPSETRPNVKASFGGEMSSLSSLSGRDEEKKNDNYSGDEYNDDDYEDDDEDYEEEFEADADESDTLSRQSTPAIASAIVPLHGKKRSSSDSTSLSVSHSAKLSTFAEEKAKRVAEEEAKNRELEHQINTRPRLSSFLSNDLSTNSEVNMLRNVPQYLLGGRAVKGFGPLLGYALALLYVSRHGLKESELFELLVRIKEQAEWNKETDDNNNNNSSNNRNGNNNNGDDAQMILMRLIIQNKNELIESLENAFDSAGNGSIARHELVEGIASLSGSDVDVNGANDQIENLLSSIAINMTADGDINYVDVLNRLEQHAHDVIQFQFENNSSISIGNEDGSSLESTSNVASDILFGDDMNFLNDSVAPGHHSSSSVNKSLDKEMEEALHIALVNLGVIFASKDRVFIMPLESEALRDVVWWRYVGSKEGQAKWHAHIISFFMEQSPSLRRCEELPWHLFHCRRWCSLRNTLVDLRTFDIMYNGTQLKGELFDYWRALIQGPLFMSDGPESRAYQGKIDIPKNQVLLDELSSASVLGLTENQVRKERLRGQMAPFDIVDEYNRAVETWHHGVRPSTQRLEAMITNLSEFMAWFSEGMNAIVEPPPFLRKCLDFEELKDVGVEQKDVLGKLSLLNHEDKRKEEEAEESLTALKSGLKTHKDVVVAVNSADDKYAVSTAGLLRPNYYYYNRWIWVMFPWLALKNASLYSEQMSSGLPAPSKKGSLLQNATELMAFSQEKGVRGEPVKAKKEKSAGYTFGGKVSGVFADEEMIKKERRFWEVKKVNPKAESKVTPSEVRDHAMVAHESKLSAANKMFDRLNEKDRIQGTGVREKPRPHRMMLTPSLKDLAESSSSSNIPFAYSSSRSQKHGSRFPSVEKMHKERLIKDEKAMDSAAQKASERFGGQEPPQNLEQLLEWKRNEEMPFSASSGGDMGYLPAHALTFPSTNEDAITAQNFARAGKLREVYDKLRLEAKTKGANLVNMSRAAEERARKDDHVYRSMLQGEEVMNMLQTRLHQMNYAVRDASYLGDFFSRIEEVMYSNPAKDKKHLDSLEQQLVLSRQQQEDMMHRRNALYEEKETIEKKLVPKFKAEWKKVKNQRAKLEIQVQAKREELGDTRRKLDDVLSGRRDYADDQGSAFLARLSPARAIAGSAAGFGAFFSDSSRPPTATKALSPASLLKGKGKNNGLHEGMHEQEADADADADVEVNTYKSQQIIHLMDRLSEVTGTTDGDELVNKFNQSVKLEASLNHQKRYHEQRLNALKSESSDLQKELDELQFVGGDGIVDTADEVESLDVRKMDALATSAEMRCNQNLKLINRQAALIHLIQSGVSHLNNLVNTMDKHVKLPVVKVGNHVVNDSSINAFVKELSITEERLILVIEALTLGSNKQLGDDRHLSIAQKQSEIADGIHKTRIAAALERNKNKKSYGLMNAPSVSSSSNSPRGIRILLPDEQDSAYDYSTSQMQIKSDNRADVDDLALLATDVDIGKEEIVKFVNEALNTKSHRVAQRKAYALSDGKKSNHRDLGLTMDTVLAETEMARRNKEGPVGLVKETLSPRSRIAVHDREGIKSKSKKFVKGKDKEGVGSGVVVVEE